MANQTARDTLEYLYCNVTTDSNKLRDIFPMATTTFYRNMRILRAGGTLKRRIGSGRPRVLAADQRRSLAMIVLRKSMWSIDNVNDHFTERQNVRVSHGTAYNVLKQAGVTKRLSKKIPNISPKQEEQRVTFCRIWLVRNFFDNVFITDECTFQLHRNTVLVWCSRNKPRPTKAIPKFSPKIMVWGALS